MKAYRSLLIVVSSTLVVACAHTPDVTVGYYMPRSKVSIKAIRTVACDSNDHPVVATTVTPEVKHEANTAERQLLPFKKLQGAFADSDIKVELTEDGRLKGVNASSLGQGEVVLKAAMTLAAVALGMDRGTGTYTVECGHVRKAGGDKPVTLSYELDVDLNLSGRQTMTAEETSENYASNFGAAIGEICAAVVKEPAPLKPVDYSMQPGDVLLTLRQPGTASIFVTGGEGVLCAKQGGKATILWQGKVPVSQFGTEYRLPVPRAVMFGKQAFAVSIAESGAIGSLQYASNTGAAQAMGAGSATLTALQGETAKQKAEELKAEADLIAQQQRWVTCNADPKNCK